MGSSANFYGLFLHQTTKQKSQQQMDTFSSEESKGRPSDSKSREEEQKRIAKENQEVMMKIEETGALLRRLNEM